MIELYNTLTRQKEPLRVPAGGKLGMYVCGPTVYDMSHVGHARVYVAFDVIVRYLRLRGYQVTHVRNYTDVDDKIIQRAQQLGEESYALSERFIREFNVDMRALGVEPADVEPKVTEHIPDIVRFVEELVKKGAAYVSGGDVYFEVARFADYGKLSKRNLDDLQAGARVEVNEKKKSPLDFALWKTAKPGEPSWDSPWGKGRPGWHIECSAMSSRYLGDSFDVHGGGMDLIFPHHENEVAQSEANSGKTFVHQWMHNGFVEVDKTKMSKSLGNFFTIRAVTARHEPEAVRLFLLGTHYRGPINFDVQYTCGACGKELAVPAATEGEVISGWQCSCGARGSFADAVHFPGIDDAERRLDYFYASWRKLGEALRSNPGDAKGEVLAHPALGFAAELQAAMENDFNTAQALGTLSAPFALVNELVDKPAKKAEKAKAQNTLARLHAELRPLLGALGLVREEPRVYLERRRTVEAARRKIDTADVARQIGEREAARKSKDWARADAIRDQLKAHGIELRDGADGTEWGFGS